jgi:hypothetical protein
MEILENLKLSLINVIDVQKYQVLDKSEVERLTNEYIKTLQKMNYSIPRDEKYEQSLMGESLDLICGMNCYGNENITEFVRFWSHNMLQNFCYSYGRYGICTLGLIDTIIGTFYYPILVCYSKEYKEDSEKADKEWNEFKEKLRKRIERT